MERNVSAVNYSTNVPSHQWSLITNVPSHQWSLSVDTTFTWLITDHTSKFLLTKPESVRSCFRATADSMYHEQRYVCLIDICRQFTFSVTMCHAWHFYHVLIPTVIIYVYLFIYLSYIQGGSNMTGTDLCVNKPHCAAAVRPWESEATTSTLAPAGVRTSSVLSGSC